MKISRKPTVAAEESDLLLRFTFENAFCFAGEASLSLTPTSDNKHENHISKGGRPGAPNVLRAAGIYGANGHGKTKLVDAIWLVKRLACGQPEDALATLTSFRLDKAFEHEPTRFVVNFRIESVDYEFGLIVQDGRIEQEWLFETEKRQEVMLYTRERVNSRNPDENYKFEFGAKLRNSKSPSSRFSMAEYLQFVGAGLKEDRSFLAEAKEKKVRRLSRCFDWFCHTLQVVKAESRYTNLHAHAARDSEFLDYLSDALNKSDTGIQKLKINRTDMPEDRIGKLPFAERTEILDQIKSLTDDQRMVFGSPDGPALVIEKGRDGISLFEFSSMHRGKDGDVEFDILEESSGTRRLMDLYPMLYNLISGDQVYVVDELDRKLHPLLAYNFVNAFLSSNRGQLIFTTHTTHLLDLDLLRRDEVWLVQKRDNGSSELYSLSDFKIRSDLDVRKGYLQGRFGGIPFLGDANALGWL